MLQGPRASPAADPTIGTQVCNIYFDNNKQIPSEIHDEIDKCMVKLEKTMGQKLGETRTAMPLGVRSSTSSPCPA